MSGAHPRKSLQNKSKLEAVLELANKKAGCLNAEISMAVKQKTETVDKISVGVHDMCH